MKTCFVIMGFGVKMDYRNSQKINLDLTYKKVIKPLFENCFQNYNLLRADEICYSGIIDKDMYELLLKADLVIADITTENVNAIYELGVRHALRPASTIILMRKGRSLLPFDISHLRIVQYGNLEGKRNEKNVNELKNILKEFIEGCEERDENYIDSPVYEFLRNLCPPRLEKHFLDVVDSKDETKLSIAKMVAEANNHMVERKFLEAAKCWEKLHKILPQYEYVVQQWALTRYKSEYPSTVEALEDGWKIIGTLCPENSLDIETLGIAGAICKRMHIATDDDSWLEKALKFYRKGYIIDNNYYTGENVANCLLRKMLKCAKDENEFVALDYERKSICETIIKILSAKQDDNMDVWEYASMAVCNYHLGNFKAYQGYREIFFSKAIPWMKDTFNATMEELEMLTKRL